MSIHFNYKHLYYFWVVAKEGGISRAAEKLDMAVQTVSAQVRELEQSLGRTLLERTGRRLVLTPDGEVARDYAESIFALGTELRRVMAGRAEPRPSKAEGLLIDSVGLLLTEDGKRALGQAILAEIGETVDSPDQVDDEARDLLRLLTANAPCPIH